MSKKAKNDTPRQSEPAKQKVGPGNPPRDKQFQKGRSGNPKGRPKGSKNLSTIIMEAARDQVAATVNGRSRKISKVQAAAMQLATKAASGDAGSIARFLDWIDEIESRTAAAIPAEFPFGAEDLEVLREIYRRMMKNREPDETGN
jgi:hypothetical protein